MSSVWVQLFYKGKDEPEGQPIPIEASEIKYGGIIAGLKEAVKDKMAEELTHCSAAKLVIYSPETTPPFSEQTSIRGDKILKELIDELGNKNPRMSICYDHPLIVVAPAPAPHPPGQGKQLSCSRLPWNGKKRCCN